MERKRFEAGGAVKSAGPDGTALVVIAETGVVDSDGDVVLPGAIGVQSVPLLPAHDWASVPLGRADTYEAGSKVYASLSFNLAIPAAQEWHSALLFDLEHPPPKMEYSWGYNPTKARPGEVDGRRVRLLEQVHLHEVSPVLVGASVGTRTLAAKRFDPGAAGVLAEGKRHADAYTARVRAELQSIYLGLVKAAVDEHQARKEATCFVRLGEHPDPGLAAAAVACAEVCADELGVALPGVCWVLPETARHRAYAERYGTRDWPHLVVDEDVLGAYRRSTGTVFLRADLGFDRLLPVVAHELAHHAGADEPEARAYQAEWARRLNP